MHIESLRAVAALGVLTGHIVGQGVGYGDALLTYPRRILFGGGFGVFLFFALSGYLMYRPFAARDLSGGSSVSLRQYAINRALRILPLYYAVLAVLLAADHNFFSPSLWLRFGTFTETYFSGSAGAVDGPMWSLCCEILFYALLPIMALCLGRISAGSVRLTMAYLVALGVFTYMLRRVVLDDPTIDASTWRYAFVTNFVFFVPGMLLAVMHVTWQERRPAWVRGPLGASTAWLLTAAVLWLYVFYDYSAEVVVLAATFVTVGACVLPLKSGVGLRCLGWRPLAAIGVASYSLYLWHFRIVSAFPAGSSMGHAVQLATVLVPLCIIVALASYRVIEEPCLRLRRRWAFSNARAGAGSAAGGVGTIA